MGRGSRPIRRWAKDRQRKKKARENKGAPPAAAAKRQPAKPKPS